MENKKWKYLLLLFFLMHLVPVSHGLKEDEVLKKVGFDQRLNNRIPLEAVFLDESGKPVKLGDFLGKPVLLTLVYFECPMLCTLSLNGLVKALRALSFDAGNQFEVITVSFDARETPNLAAAKKKTYLQEYNRPKGDSGWHFLTGQQSSIDQ